MPRRVASSMSLILAVLFMAAGMPWRGRHDAVGVWRTKVMSAPAFPAQLQDSPSLARSLAARPFEENAARQWSSTPYLHTRAVVADVIARHLETIARATTDGGARVSRRIHRATGPPSIG